MAYEDPQLLHLDTMLTQVSVGYTNEEFVGDNLFPAVNVGKESDKYYVQEKVGFTPFDDIRADNATTKELPPMSLSRDSYFAEEHALKDWVGVNEIDNADAPLNPLTDAAERVSDTILLNREVALASLATTTGNYATGHTTTLAGADQWNNYTTSDPIDDLKVARDQVHISILRLPTVCLLGYEVATKLEDHPKFLDRVKTSPLAMTTLGMIGDLVNIPKFVRGGAAKNTANPGQAVTLAYIWGKDVVVAYVPARPAVKTPAFGYEYNWPFQGSAMPSDRWYDNDRKAWAVRVTRRYDLKFAAVDAVSTGKAAGGYLIKSAIA